MKKIRKVVIPAAGLGTRFLPATKAIPKEMLPIIDTPIIQLIVEEAVASGIEDVILVTARHKEAIENHFDYNYELDDTLSKKQKEELLESSKKVSEMANVISVRQKNPKGLGHAVWCAKSVVGDEPFAVILGDDLVDAKVPATQQCIDLFEQKDSSVVGVMEVAEADVSKYGIVGGKMESDRLMKVDRVVEKPSPADAPSRLALPGRYILKAEIFKHLENTKPGHGGEIQLTDGLEALAASSGLYAYKFDGNRYDAGDRLGYLEANMVYALKRPELKDAVKALMRKYADE